MADLVFPATMTVSQAVVDDTLRLWIAFEDDVWLWVDLAGYLENCEVVKRPPFVPVQDGLSLWVTPHIELPLPLLFLSEEAAIEQGICVCAISRSSESWYRPLSLTQTVRATYESDPYVWLMQLLSVNPADLHQAACAHAVNLPTFIRRLADLCVLLQNTGWSAAEVLQAPQLFLQGSRGPLTLWDVIARGQIGLAEQVVVAKAWY